MRLVHSFRYAFEGAVYLLRTQPNARYHLFAAMIVIGVCACLKMTATEWAIIATCIAMVCMAEAFNSAIEMLADRVTRERDPQIKIVKDVAAAATLFAAMGAMVVGICLIMPKLIQRFMASGAA